uniref:Uncharacterized protein n=1 Tax=Arundo donax TaxID=35708 RepID=A0A0A8XWW1_ARUDO
MHSTHQVSILEKSSLAISLLFYGLQSVIHMLLNEKFLTWGHHQDLKRLMVLP